MKLSVADFRSLRWHTLALCAATLVCAATIYSSNEYLSKTLREQRTAQNQLNDVRNHLQSAREDQRNVVSYAEEYSSLRTFRIISDDQRLDWMEGLEKLRKQRLVNDFHYSIAPQRAYVPKPPINNGNFEIRYSETRLQLQLLHEGQLLDFFAALRNQIKGWYQLEGCSLQRASSDEETADPSVSTHIKADCTGGWLTLKNRNTPP